MATNVISKKSSLDEILECPLCLYQLKLPHTLQECFHTFCQTCIEAVPKKVKNGDIGWFCPMCRNFTKEETIKQNFFINELITIYNIQKNGSDLRKLICTYCPEDKEIPATFKCLDCKIELCETCEKGHVKIPFLKGHKIVPLGTETEKVVDHLIFCPIHKDKLIEFNCQPCEEPLCINCKVLCHDGHKTETIQMALERLLPVINEENEKIKENEEVIRKEIRKINAKIDDTKETFSTCKEQLTTTGEEIISQIKTNIKIRKSQLSIQESKAVKRLEEIKQQLENKLNELKNLTNLVTASTSKARHVSLLSEIQGGLLQRVKATVKTKQKDLTVQLSKPHLKAVDLQNKMDPLEQLLGEIQFKEEKFEINRKREIKDQRSTCRQSDYLCDDLVAVFSKPVKKVVKEIQLPDWCGRLIYIDNKLWVAMYGKTLVNIYSTNGDRLQNLKGHCYSFRVIKKASTGDFVAGGNNGLYVTNDITANWIQIANGSFSDICVGSENEISALEYSKSEVITFFYETNDQRWQIKSSFTVNGIKQKSALDTLLYDGYHIYICSYFQETVYKFTTTGHCALQHKTKYKWPMLCGTDRNGHILVTSWGNNKLFLLIKDDQGDFIHKDVGILSESLQYPVDVVIDNEHNVWVLSGFCSCKLTKYTVK